MLSFTIFFEGRNKNGCSRKSLTFLSNNPSLLNIMRIPIATTVQSGVILSELQINCEYDLMHWRCVIKRW